MKELGARSPQPASRRGTLITSSIPILSPICFWHQRFPLLSGSAQIYNFLLYFICHFCMVEATGGIPYQFILPY